MGDRLAPLLTVAAAMVEATAAGAVEGAAVVEGMIGGEVAASSLELGQSERPERHSGGSSTMGDRLEQSGAMECAPATVEVEQMERAMIEELEQAMLVAATVVGAVVAMVEELG